MNKKKTNEELLEILADDYGYPDSMSMLEDAVIDSVVPAICPKCEYTTDMEPDQDEGYCELCENTTVKSCLILAGII